MRATFRTLLLPALLAGVLVALPGTAGSAEPDEPVIGTREVAIPARLVNRTVLPCAAPGDDTVVRGTLVGPVDQLARPAAVTVFLHDFATGAWFWTFGAAPGLDLTRALAERGLVSLVLDRPGYGDSPLRQGMRSCLGAQATVAHQVVGWLREQGTGTVVLAGHSVGAAVAELEAATFHDVDGLVQLSWSDAGASPRAIAEAARQHLACLLGGDRSAGRPAYGFYAPGESGFREIMFHAASPAVQEAAARLRSADPCGDALSLGPLVGTNLLLAPAVRVPVLLLFGAEDALNRPDAAALQRLGLAHAEVTSHVLPGTGGALPLEPSAPQTQELIARWVTALLETGKSR